MICSANRKPRQDGDPILTALIFQVEGEGKVHPGEPGEFRDLVNALRALDTAINFLQPYQVNMLASDHVSDTRQIEFLIHPDADVNVVSHHANSSGEQVRRGPEKNDEHAKPQNCGHQSSAIQRASVTQTVSLRI